MFDINWFALMPLLGTVVMGLLTMLMAVLLPEDPKKIGYFSITALVAGTVATAAAWAAHPGLRVTMFNQMYTVDGFSLFFYILFMIIAAVTLLVALPAMDRDGTVRGEFFALLFFALSGMFVMVSSYDLITLFVGFETMSLSIYVMVGWRRNSVKSNEATLKYYFLGAFAAAMFLYGIALLYGTAGSVNLNALHAFFASTNLATQSLALIGALLVLVAVLFKVAAVPFHMWTPDVYEGAPTPVTGFMATAVKAAAFALMIRLFMTVYAGGEIHAVAQAIIFWVSIATMFVGNIFALGQKNLKRMLAYSGIAHTGYLLMAITALPDADSATAILYYLVAYAFTNLGALACVSYMGGRDERLQNIDDFAGAAFKFPLVGFGMAVCMLSLIGFPPTAGFFGKYTLFLAVMKAGFMPLVIVAIINSILSVYYYLRVLVVMFMKAEQSELPEGQPSAGVRWAIAYATVAVLWAGMGTFNLTSLLPGAGPLLASAKSSISAFVPTLGTQTGMR